VNDLVSARSALADDISTTAELAIKAQEAARPERGGRWLLDHDNLEQLAPLERHLACLAAANSHLVVGCIDESVVGYAVAMHSKTTTGQLCMIEELVVHPEARAIGVGSAILAGVREWAISTNCQAIESQVLPGNRAAKNFFERVGMKTRKMRVSANLD